MGALTIIANCVSNMMPVLHLRIMTAVQSIQMLQCIVLNRNCVQAAQCVIHELQDCSLVLANVIFILDFIDAKACCHRL